MGLWYDDIKGKSDQGIEALSIKKVVVGILDDPKENDVCVEPQKSSLYGILSHHFSLPFHKIHNSNQ